MYASKSCKHHDAHAKRKRALSSFHSARRGARSASANKRERKGRWKHAAGCDNELLLRCSTERTHKECVPHPLCSSDVQPDPRLPQARMICLSGDIVAHLIINALRLQERPL
jgi:hypothetical protein